MGPDAVAAGGSCSLSEAVDGWAAAWPGAAGPGVLGGAGADAAHTYDVRTRTELVQALYPDAVMNADGTFTSALGPDETPKLINIHGTISLNTNRDGVEQTEADYACEGYDLGAYLAAYDPKVYNRQLVDGEPVALAVCPDSEPESRRLCSAERQGAVMRVYVGSNTSIIGAGSDAKIIHGSLMLSRLPGPADGLSPCERTTAPPAAANTRLAPSNVVIRNIAFEDAFDFFPAWDPTDSYNAPPDVAEPTALYPKCQATYAPDTDDGPHQCPGGRWNPNYDNITISRASGIWIDHCSFSDAERTDDLYPSVWKAPYDWRVYLVQHHDGAVDISQNSDFVTLSYNRFIDHDKLILIGSSDTVSAANGFGALNVTLHHNLFEQGTQRMPRVRFGKVHIYNNFMAGTQPPDVDEPADLSKPWASYNLQYAIGVGHLAKVYAENNVYEVAPSPGDPERNQAGAVQLFHKSTSLVEGDPDFNEKTYFHDSGTLLNGQPSDLFAYANETAAARVPPLPPLEPTESYWTPSTDYHYELTPSDRVKELLTVSAGPCK